MKTYDELEAELPEAYAQYSGALATMARVNCYLLALRAREVASIARFLQLENSDQSNEGDQLVRSLHDVDGVELIEDAWEHFDDIDMNISDSNASKWRDPFAVTDDLPENLIADRRRGYTVLDIDKIIAAMEAE